MSKITNDVLTRSATGKMLYNCTHIAAMGVKKLMHDSKMCHLAENVPTVIVPLCIARGPRQVRWCMWSDQVVTRRGSTRTQRSLAVVTRS